jgi:hypothetical protein
MTASEVLSVAGTILASLGGGAAIVLGLSNWLGRIWADRLMEAEKGKYAKELEELKAGLTKSIEGEKAHYLRELEFVRARVEQTAEDRTRKLQALMRHYERQIEEFYGPLFNMVNQILYVAHDIQRDLLSGVTPDKAEIVREYYQTNYFAPIHDKIRDVLQTRLYLVEGAALPETFEENVRHYLRHITQERDQRALWRDHGVDTSFLAGAGWPWDLHRDIRAGFAAAMRNYQQCLDGLKA